MKMIRTAALLLLLPFCTMAQSTQSTKTTNQKNVRKQQKNDSQERARIRQEGQKPQAPLNKKYSGRDSFDIHGRPVIQKDTMY
ncbi:MAG: hypothetical protein QM743_00180 [Chitinophagaceae bacterium]